MEVGDIFLNELYHHGVKGQKWGVRRYQNEDGTWTETGKKRRRINSIPKVNARKEDINFYDDITLKKGTVFNRVTSGVSSNKGMDDLEDLSKRNKTYVSVTADDLEQYKYYGIEGALGFSNYPGQELYIDKYSTNKKIKVAGEKYLVQYTLDKIGDKKISDFVTENTIKYDKRALEIYNKVKDFPVSAAAPYISFSEKPKPGYEGATIIGQKAVRKYFNNTFFQKANIDSEVVKDFKSKGYNAILDLEDAKFADLPLIILDPSEVMTFESREKY